MEWNLYNDSCKTDTEKDAARRRVFLYLNIEAVRMS